MDTLKIELDNLKSKLLGDQIQPTLTKLGRNSHLVSVNIRKSLLLRVIIDENETIESAKLYAAEAINLKPERAAAIVEFLKRANAMLSPTSTTESQLNGYQLSGMFEKCTLMLVGEDYLRESLDVIESRSKSCRFELDHDESRSVQASGRLDNKKQKHGKKNEDNVEEESKKKFKGSEFIFQRIKWDENVDKSQVVIGYLDRFLGIKDIRFEDFKGVHEDKEGVPFHRIRYFKINGRVVWDREQKIDLLTGSGESVTGFFDHRDAVNSSSTRLDQVVIDENEDVFVKGSVLVYSDNKWNDSSEILEAKSILGDDFRLLSYNLMSKVNFKKSIQSKMNFKKSQAEVINRQLDDEDEYGLKPLEKIDRMSRALASIRDNSWDFLVLQECDLYEETRLKEDEFVRNNYFICSLDRDLSKVEHPNCVILSKTRPTMFKLLPLTPRSNKYALLAKFDSRHGRILLVNIHLSSNKAKNFIEKRQTQLETLKRYLIDQADEFDLLAEHSFLCGDFNFGDSVDNEAECTLVKDLFEKNNGFCDLVPGAFTFDPERNFSAAVTAFNQQPRRLDRVLYKASNQSLELTSACLVNTAPFRIPDSELIRPVLYQPFLEIREYTQQNRIKINDTNKHQKLEIKCDQSVGNDEFWLHISDHYGIECQFRSKKTESSRLIVNNEDDELKLVHKSALAIIVPNHVGAEFIQKVRNIHDPQFNRWPPHINILYPFFEDITLDTSQDSDSTQISQILTCLSRFKPFRCDLDKMNTFDNNGIVFLEPTKESGQQMRKIYDELVGLFTSNK